MQIQAMTRLERSIRESRDTDKTLVNWWLFVLLLSWITFGIMSLVVYFQRLSRRDRHFERIQSTLRDAVACTREVAAERAEDVEPQLRDIESNLAHAEQSFLKARGAALWFILTLLTLGIAGVYPLYYLTRDFYQLQRFEQDLLDDLSKAWTKLGITKYPVSVDVTVPERNFWLYLVLTVLTLGIWGLYWDYTIHTDPERVFKESSRWEETMLASFRQMSL